MAGRDFSLCKRKRDTEVDKDATPKKQKPVWHALREAQRQCGCTTRTLKTVFETVRPFLKPTATKSWNDDKQLYERGNAVVLQLHGCVRCDDFVFSPDMHALRCPKCGHPRFNQKKKHHEVSGIFFVLYSIIFFLCVLLCCEQVFWYFPLKPQLTSLLQNESYRDLLLHEIRRVKNKNYLSDVYDTPRWRKLAGEPTEQLERIVYQICIDSFPWTSRKHAVMRCEYWCAALCCPYCCQKNPNRQQI